MPATLDTRRTPPAEMTEQLARLDAERRLAGWLREWPLLTVEEARRELGLAATRETDGR